MAKLAQRLDGADLRALGGDLFHPGVGLVLLAITVLNVYKPASPTPIVHADVWQPSRLSAEAQTTVGGNGCRTLPQPGKGGGRATVLSPAHADRRGVGPLFFDEALVGPGSAWLGWPVRWARTPDARTGRIFRARVNLRRCATE